MAHLFILASLVFCLLSRAEGGTPVRLAAAEAHPLEGIVQGILAAYDEASVVCLGERHGRQMDYELWIRLLQHPDFPKKVDTILVEFADAHWQGWLDRYYLEGEDRPLEELQRVWRDASGGRGWDRRPIYRQLFFAVREMNLRLPREERVRVLAGDNPTDWSRIKTWKDLPWFIDRGSFPAGVLDREVLSKGLTSLVIYGSSHCERWKRGFPPELGEKYPGQVWVVLPMGGRYNHDRIRLDLDLGEEPALVHVAASPVAARPASDYLSRQRPSRLSGVKLGAVVDAFLYFGALPDPEVPVHSRVLEDPAYARELKRRDKIVKDWSEEHRKRGWQNPP